MDKLPLEIKIKILGYLPYKDIFNTRLINKEWDLLSRDNTMWFCRSKKHLEVPYYKKMSIDCQSSWYDYYWNRMTHCKVYILKFIYNNRNKVKVCYNIITLSQLVFQKIICLRGYDGYFINIFESKYKKYKYIDFFTNAIKGSIGSSYMDYRDILKCELGELYCNDFYLYIIEMIKGYMGKPIIHLQFKCLNSVFVTKNDVIIDSHFSYLHIDICNDSITNIHNDFDPLQNAISISNKKHKGNKY